MENNHENYEQEIDLSQLIRILFMRWYIVLAALITIIGITGFYSYVILDDVYTSQVTFYVKVDDDTINPVTGRTLSTQLVNDYIEFSTTKIVLDDLRVILAERNDFDYAYTNSQLRQLIDVTGRANTSVLDLRVTHPNPKAAYIIADELINVIQSTIESEDIKHLFAIDIWGQAEAATRPSGPNRLLYMAIGVVLGGMVGVFAVFMIEFFDKSIKTTKDIEGKLGLRVLGLIPDYDIEGKEVAE